MHRQLSRRKFVRAGALALGGLAGCLSDGSDPPTEQSPVDSTGSPTDDASDTQSGTDAESPGSETTDDETPTEIDHERIQWRATGDRVAGLVLQEGALYTATYWDVRRHAPTDGTVDWTHQLAEPSDAICHDGGLAVGGEFAYATGCDGVQALAVGDGAESWSTDAVSGMQSPTVNGDRLYASAYDGVTALATSDGSERWTVTLDDAQPSRPAAADGVAYVGAGDGVVRAVDAGDGSGRVRWTHDTESTRAHVPTVHDGTIYVGTSDPQTDSGALLALDTDGTQQWRVETTQTLSGARPVVAGDTVYLGSASGTLAAHARSDGARRWGFDAGDWLVTQPAVDAAADTLYCGGNDGRLHAVDTADGAERWSAPVGYSNTAPEFDDQHVYAPSNRGLYALSRD